MNRRQSALSRRRSQAVDSFRAVSDCIGEVKPDISLFAVTRGQFSMIDVISYLVHSIGRAGISVWTWTVADYEVEAVTALMNDGAVSSARLVVDYSASHRNKALLKSWFERFGPDSVRVCKTHAKIARVFNDEFRLLARGSMNLNYNPRLEQFDVTGGGPDFDLVTRLEDAMPIVGLEPSFAEVANASQLGGAFERRALEMFAGLPTWKP